MSIPEAVAGCAAGVVGTLIGYPLDSIKTRMQAGAGGKQAASGMLSMGRHILQAEGGNGFYRGVASPLAALTILNTLNFSSYATFRRVYGVDDAKIVRGGFEWRVSLAAASVGPLASLISTPFELVKTQMVINSKGQSAQAGAKRPSSVKAALALVREHGFRSLYVAHAVNTTREVVFLGTYFTVYEHCKNGLSNHLSRSWGISDKGSIPVAGGIAGAVGWFLSFPFDCVKSNIQGLPFVKGGAPPPTAREVARSLLRQKGLAGLYSGVLPSITRAFLVSASRFMVYEGVLTLMRPQ